ncbi:MAG TPA: hypothetical protein DCY13_12930 [Verrucomicrobiales bacterium]|nr:hypothetical protein [Verrucomicrobiales bacterium]
MALQDLTPQLRTRLNRMELAVGLFITLAALLLLTGTFFYLRHTAERKGWLVPKARYYTFLRSASGIKVGDPVKLMGFDVGEVTEVTAMPADDQWSRENQLNVYVAFVVRAPNYGYLWVDSRARVAPSDLLGNRMIEVTRGVDGAPTYRDTGPTGPGFWSTTTITGIYEDGGYQPVTPETKGFWMLAIEPPTFNDRADALLGQAEEALPNILSLTNQISEMLTLGASAAENLDSLLLDAQPAVANVREITDFIKNPEGGLGEWLLPTNISDQLFLTLDAAEGTLRTTDYELATVSSNLAVSLEALRGTLDNLADLTGSLNRQVQANTNILGEISSIVTNADTFIQGLRRHWFLRSAFKEDKKGRK